MKCLIIDEVDPCIKEELSKYMQVDEMLHLKHSGLEHVIGDYEVLIMRVAPKIDEELLSYAAKLKYIGVCAIGLDHVDMAAAKAHGVTVQNAPGLSANAVAELTICKMLELARCTVPANNDVVYGKGWPKYAYVGCELSGRTVGILGFGRIGQKVGRLARAFGMKVLAYDPYLPAEIFAKEEAKSSTIDEVLMNSDFISIHVPLTPETKNLVNAAKMKEMRNHACVINMSRGGIVNEAEMAECLQAGEIGGYAADVMEKELGDGVPEMSSPLFACKNFIVTPHLGAQTLEAAHAIGVFTADKCKAYFGLN